MSRKLADLHSHYPMHLLERQRRGFSLRAAVMWIANRLDNYRSSTSGPRVDMEQLRRGGVQLVLSVLYNPFSEIDLHRKYASPPAASYPAELFKQLKQVTDDVEAQGGAIVRTAAEFEAAIAAGKTAFVHCVEGGFHLGSTPEEVRETVAELAERGVAYITLAHLFWRRVATNAPAIPFLPDWLYNLVFRQRTDEPLSELGSAAVRAMYEHHVLIDIAHMRADAIEATFKLVEQLDRETGAAPGEHPVIATHVGMRLGRRAQKYNLDKKTVQRIAARGGVIGLIMAQHQLVKGVRRRNTRTLDESMPVIVEHLDTLRKWANSDAVAAIGSDLDGFIKPTMGGIETAGDLAQLGDRLEQQYGAAEATKILWGNVARVVGQALERRP
ncbi:MAG: rane dipeptidase [Solirubrobacteraceae bacterium]|jgi:microsomal dipeptidase-like Zn-dependent dipeptidase|nr:rane dipeptidase [Solirubrobacteraceae bacterium]